RAIEAKSSRSSAEERLVTGVFPAGIADLQQRFSVFATEASALRALQEVDKLHVRTPVGQGLSYPVGQLIEFYGPNDLGFFQKVGMFFPRFWTFLSDEPREANTEGGIFPAIFGTFVMTLIMSAAVTPFGVLAAIYLR